MKNARHVSLHFLFYLFCEPATIQPCNHTSHFSFLHLVGRNEQNIEYYFFCEPAMQPYNTAMHQHNTTTVHQQHTMRPTAQPCDSCDQQHNHAVNRESNFATNNQTFHEANNTNHTNPQHNNETIHENQPCIHYYPWFYMPCGPAASPVFSSLFYSSAFY